MSREEKTVVDSVGGGGREADKRVVMLRVAFPNATRAIIHRPWQWKLKQKGEKETRHKNVALGG